MRSLLKRLIKPSAMVVQSDAVLIPDVPGEEPEETLEEEAQQEEKKETVSPEKLAEALLFRARETASKESEAILLRARAAATGIREQARQEGYAQGLEEGRQEALASKKKELADLISRLSSMMQELAQRHEEYLGQYAHELKYLALDIADKLLYKRLERDDEELKSLVRHAVSSVRNVEWMKVEISDQMPLLFATLQEEFSAAEYAEHIQLEQKDVPLGTVRINLPDGVLDASIQTQLENLKESFSQLDEQVIE